MKEARLPASGALTVHVRGNVLPGRNCIVLSSGYGVFGFDEPVQAALTATLDSLEIGWAQYRYVERAPTPATSDLLISSGFNALSLVTSWVRDQGSTAVGAFGISFGANISLELALSDPEVQLLLLVNPVLDYVRYRSRQLGADALRAWKDAGVITMDYEQPVKSYYRFIEEAERQELWTRMPALRARIVACQADQDTNLGTEYLAKLEEVCGAQTHVVVGADHPFTDAGGIRQFLDVVHPVLVEWGSAGDAASRGA